jgi:hypothetical protein
MQRDFKRIAIVDRGEPAMLAGLPGSWRSTPSSPSCALGPESGSSGKAHRSCARRGDEIGARRLAAAQIGQG